MTKLLISMLMVTTMTASANQPNQRQTIILTESQQAHVLQEMRQLLAGTQAIIAALSKNDMKAVVQHARSLGMSMKKPENNLHDILPVAFMHMGKAVHRKFDAIANDAETLKNAKHTLVQLSENLAQCNACHEIYRIEEKPIATGVNGMLEAK